MTARQLVFTRPGSVELQTVNLPDPREGEVLVETAMSGISAGTERLLWRGEFPRDILLDEGIPALRRPAAYPCPYGYDLVGRIPGRRGLVLTLHPHADRAVVPEDAVHPLPPTWPPELGVLLPNAETALNLVLDAAPRVGERVVVFGLGVVGLLTAGLLTEFPLDRLVAADPSPERRDRLAAAPHVVALDPAEAAEAVGPDGADLVLELSGQPGALQAAVDLAGYSGRIIVGSWYGGKTLDLDLGARFHRRRLSLVSSQVSTLAPELRGRWTHRRRMEAAIARLDGWASSDWVTHRFPLDRAAEAYRLIDGGAASWLQVVLHP